MKARLSGSKAHGNAALCAKPPNAKFRSLLDAYLGVYVAGGVLYGSG